LTAKSAPTFILPRLAGRKEEQVIFAANETVHFQQEE
jgi:hypothetical protein